MFTFTRIVQLLSGLLEYTPTHIFYLTFQKGRKQVERSLEMSLKRSLSFSFLHNYTSVESRVEIFGSPNWALNEFTFVVLPLLLLRRISRRRRRHFRAHRDTHLRARRIRCHSNAEWESQSSKRRWSGRSQRDPVFDVNQQNKNIIIHSVFISFRMKMKNKSNKRKKKKVCKKKWKTK